MEVTATHKVCSTCRTDKAATGFYKDPKGPCGLRSQCKECCSNAVSERAKKNKSNPIIVTDKKCKTCKLVKVKDSFHFYPLSKDGLNSNCKECVSALEKTKREANRTRLCGVSIEGVKKTCLKCAIEFDLREFSKNANSPDGRRPDCKSCEAERAQRYYTNHVDEICERSEVYRAENRDIVLASKRVNHLKTRYGLTLEEYYTALSLQGGGCAICLSKHSGVKGREFFSIDHNHLTGEFRGLLCIGCNSGLGSFDDNIDLLLKSISYIEKWEKSPIDFLERERFEPYFGNHVIQHFGITEEKRQELLGKQNWRCAICFDTFGNPKFCHLDHCHITGKVRGFLCRGCNTGIGRLKDSTDIIRRAIVYLNGRLR